jgi:hypothetical protein
MRVANYQHEQHLWAFGVRITNYQHEQHLLAVVCGLPIISTSNICGRWYVGRQLSAQAVPVGIGMQVALSGRAASVGVGMRIANF